jgi:probable HAF family extracellular repeat protein
MKSNLLACITAMTLFFAPAIPLSAQQPRYKLIDMGTLGGPQSYLNSGNDGNNAVTVLSNRGVLAGWADTSTPDPFPTFCFNDDCFVSHAFRWHAGVRTDLGALDSTLSSQAVWISANGLIAGTSENGQFDPLFNGLPEIRAVLWRKSHITDLGTLPEGGFESSANAVNSKGQVTGWATNTIPDSYSMIAPGFLPTQTRAFLWQGEAMRDLGTLGGPDALAQFINERGEVVGWSYTSSAPNTSCPFFLPLATGSFIWDKQNGMRDLGTLGGTCVIATGVNDNGVVVGDNVNDQPIQRAFLWRNGLIQDLGGSIGGEQAGAEGISRSGQVIGFATLAGEILSHATLWKRVGEITDLGVLDGDLCSFASSINSKAQIVGASQAGTPNNGCTFDSSTRAFLWENGSILDLNTLIPPGASLHLQWAKDINDRGEIAGSGLDTDGNVHDFLLIPCAPDNTSDCQEEIVGTTETTEARPALLTQQAQLANPRNSIRQMLRGRLSPGPHFLTPDRAGVATGSLAALEAETPLSITSGSPPSGKVGAPYDLRCPLPCFGLFFAGFPVTAAGGVRPYWWSWSAQQGSSLPPGLMFPDLYGYQCLNVRPPAICGKPSKAGSYNVVVTVKDSESPPRHASKSYTIRIFP